MDPTVAVAGWLVSKLHGVAAQKGESTLKSLLFGSDVERELTAVTASALEQAIRRQLPEGADDLTVERFADVLDEMSVQVEPRPASASQTALEHVGDLVSDMVERATETVETGPGFEPTSSLDALAAETGIEVDPPRFAADFTDLWVQAIRNDAARDGALSGLADQLAHDWTHVGIRAVLASSTRIEDRLLEFEALLIQLAGYVDERAATPWEAELWAARAQQVDRADLGPGELMVAELRDLSERPAEVPDRVEQLDRTRRRIDHLLDALDDPAALRSWADTETTAGAAVDVETAYRALGLEQYRLKVGLEFQFAHYRGISTETSHPAVTELPLDSIFVAPLLVREVPDSTDRGIETKLARELQRIEEDEERSELAEQLRTAQAKRWEAIGTDEAVDALEAIGAHDVIVVRGVPGSGKSTLTKFLARAAVLGTENTTAAATAWLAGLTPIRVELAGFAQWRRIAGNAHRPLRDHIDERLGPTVAAAMAEELAEGRVLVLLDGIDEEPDENQRIKLASRIDDFVRDHRGNRIVVTSRPVGYQRLGGALPHYDLAPLTDEQVARFAELWQRARNPLDPARAASEARKDLAEIRKNPQVIELGRRPLILVLLLFRRFEGVHLPEQRVILYEQLITALVGSWNRARSKVTVDDAGSLDAGSLMPVLAQVAFETHRNFPSGRVSRHEIEHLFERAVIDQELEVPNPRATARAYVEALAERAGLIEESAAGFFSFWHLTFEEYLAGAHLANADRQLTDDVVAVLIAELAVDPRWKEVFVLASGYLGHVKIMPNQAAEFIGLIRDLDLPSERIQTRRATLVADILADGPGLKASATRQLVGFVISELARLPTTATGEAFTRMVLQFPALELSDDRVITDLVVVATLPSWRVRRDAVRLLANVAGVTDIAREACAAVLADEKDPDVRFHAWLVVGGAINRLPTGFRPENVALGAADQRAKLARLAEQLSLDDLSAVLASATVLLDAQSTMASDAAGALVDLMTRGDHQTCRAAAAALSADPDSVASNANPLIELLGNDDASIRYRAGEVLSHATPDTIATHADTLVQLLTDPDPDIRYRAAEALTGATPDYPAATHALVELLTNTDPINRYLAATVLTRATPDHPAATATLIELLTNPNPNTRHLAADTLTRTTPDTIANHTDTLIELLTNPNPNTRHLAADTLTRATPDHPAATATLIELLTNPNPNTRHLAADTLARATPDHPAATATLIELLTNPNPNTRHLAADTLTRATPDHPAATATLIELLTNPDSSIPYRAAHVLTRATPDTIAETLIELLTNPNPNTRRRAGDVLTRASPDTIATHSATLIGLLTNPNPDIRHLAADTLTRATPDHPAATATLIELLTKPDPDICRRADDALTRTTPDTIATHSATLIELLTNPNPHTRYYAATVLTRTTPDTIATHSDTLIELLTNPNPDIRRRAADTLTRTTPDTIATHADTLVELLTNPNPDIRHLAADLLAGLPADSVR